MRHVEDARGRSTKIGFVTTFQYNHSSSKGYLIHQLSAFIFFVMPVVILLFLYVSMAITLRGSIREGRKALHCHYHCKAAQSLLLIYF